MTVNTLAGNDTVDASGLQADAIKQLTVDGGGGDDLILGGSGADSLIGDDGDDFVDGNQAADTAFMADGDDTFSGTRATAATLSKAKTVTIRSALTVPAPTRPSTSRPTASGSLSSANRATSRWT